MANTIHSTEIKDARSMCAGRRYLVMVAEPLSGISTNDINTLVHEYTLEHQAIPAPLNYKGFPKRLYQHQSSRVPRHPRFLS